MSFLNAITLANIFESVTEVLSMVWTTFGNVISTITGNPLIFAPVLLGLGVSVIMGVIRMVKKMGVKGMGAGRRRRRR